MKLNLGCAMWGTTDNPWPKDALPNYDFGGPLPGEWLNVDYKKPPNLGAGMAFQLVDLNVMPWPWEMDSFYEVRAYHILEHLTDWLAALKEIHRVARAGALVDIVVPYEGTLFASANPYHRHFHFNHRTFEHFCRGLQGSNDLDTTWRGFDMVDQRLREVGGPEKFGPFEWRYANLQVKMRVVK